MRYVFIALAIAIGALLPLQTGINATLRLHLGHPLRAALTNFLVGGFVLFGVLLVTGRFGLPAGALRTTPPWTLIGGCIGASMVLTSLVLAPKLGGALLFAAIVAGQLSSGLLVDHFGLVGYPRHPINAGRIVGVVLMLAGLVLINRS